MALSSSHSQSPLPRSVCVCVCTVAVYGPHPCPCIEEQFAIRTSTAYVMQCHYACVCVWSAFPKGPCLQPSHHISISSAASLNHRAPFATMECGLAVIMSRDMMQAFQVARIPLLEHYRSKPYQWYHKHSMTSKVCSWLELCMISFI